MIKRAFAYAVTCVAGSASMMANGATTSLSGFSITEVSPILSFAFRMLGPFRFVWFVDKIGGVQEASRLQYYDQRTGVWDNGWPEAFLFRWSTVNGSPIFFVRFDAVKNEEQEKTYPISDKFWQSEPGKRFADSNPLPDYDVITKIVEKACAKYWRNA